MGVLITPWRWDILSIPLKASRGISAETCGLDFEFRSDDLGSCSFTPFIIYIPCIITAILVIQINFFKRNSNQKLVWPCWCIGWFDTAIVPCLVSNVYFSCLIQYSRYRIRDIGTLWHCTLLSRTPSQSIGLFFLRVLCFGVECSCYYFFDIIIFHYGFHHDSCDYRLDFYCHPLLFELRFRLSVIK